MEILSILMVAVTVEALTRKELNQNNKEVNV